MVVESGKVVHYENVKKWERGLSPVQHTTDILTKSSFLTYIY